MPPRPISFSIRYRPLSRRPGPVPAAGGTSRVGSCVTSFLRARVALLTRPTILPHARHHSNETPLPADRANRNGRDTGTWTCTGTWTARARTDAVTPLAGE